jgi:tyrosinase
MKNHYTRRGFLKAAGLAASATMLIPSSLQGNTAPSGPLVRRDIAGLTASDPIIVAYRKAIKAMQCLPYNNPLSWTYQAAIHKTTLTAHLPLWNKCEHNSIFFWPWHRMYLYWFERIIRKMSGYPKWTLPYWNWSAPGQQKLPEMFWKDKQSDLFTEHRNPDMNSESGSLCATAVDYSRAFAECDFRTASAWFEETRHKAIHNAIGGWMGETKTAAQDPIFFLHHCNIDRLWNLWLAQGSQYSNPTNLSFWRDQKFCFYDENSTIQQRSCCQILSAAEQLGYKYEEEPPQVKQDCLQAPPACHAYQREVIARLPITPITLGAKQQSIGMAIKPFKERLVQLITSKAAMLLLELDRVEASRASNVYWEVYVGASPGPLDCNPQNPNYVGNVSLFGEGLRRGAHHGFKPAHFTLPINEALEASLKVDRDRIPLTFVPRSILINGKPSRPRVRAPLHIGRIHITANVRA